MGTREMERHLERLIPMAAGVVDNEGPLLLLLIIVLEKWHFPKLIVARHRKSLSQDGLGFMTLFSFIFLVGVFVSSWLGASVLGLGERLTKKLPLIRYIYCASKQKSAATSPEIVLWWDVNTSGNNYSGSTSHSYGRTWKICWATCLMMVCLFDATSDWFAPIKSAERRLYLHPDEQNMQMNECFKQNGWSLAEKFRLQNSLSNLGYLVSENHKRLWKKVLDTGYI